MEKIGEWMAAVLKNPKDEGLIRDIREKVRRLCAEFPVYGDLGL